MIVRPAPSLPPHEAARRVAVGADPVWVSSPGGPAHGGRDLFAAAPRLVVRGPSLTALEEAWRQARERWDNEDEAGVPVPVGVGWLSYELARAWLPIPRRARDDHGWADFEVRFYDAIAVRDVASGDCRILACETDAAERLADLWSRPAVALPAPSIGAFVAETERDDHERAVERIKAYLRAGDAYQVNLARRLIAPLGPGDPLLLAAALRARAPAPHAIWMGARSIPEGPIDRYVIGNSPERFLSLDRRGQLETRPIKGTRPRQPSAREDAAMRAELLAAAKDRAEHVMIVDLERNDLGRVCRTGSVRVDDLLRVVDLPTVFHLESTVRGELRPEVGLGELLRATFPSGSVTGAPKRRAMEIIEELEPVRRGIYTGATGWLGAGGELDLAVAIRTATVADGRLSLSVGGGIVVDSVAAAEWEETEVKARAFRDVCASLR
ncbi:MAG TPA: anthranilate synthase component I family protein [Polyangia bacterium]